MADPISHKTETLSKGAIDNLKSILSPPPDLKKKKYVNKHSILSRVNITPGIIVPNAPHRYHVVRVVRIIPRPPKGVVATPY